MSDILGPPTEGVGTPPEPERAAEHVATTEALHREHLREFAPARSPEWVDDFTADQCGNCKRWARYVLALGMHLPLGSLRPTGGA